MNEVEEYISNITDSEVQRRLNEIRKIGLELFPDALEKISWGMPTMYNKKENIFHYCVHKNHISIYPGYIEKIVEKHPELKEYSGKGKGTFKFLNNRPINLDHIKTILKELID